VMRRALGELSEQLLGDVWVVPEKLQADGYQFYYPDVHATIGAALRRGGRH
jgi:NAD dependent epimerase/dehydratase family enzyme